VLTVKNLCVNLPVHGGELQVVRGVDFELQWVETVCIVGESGCGKSMTTLALMGLLPPWAERRAARLEFEGVDLTRLSRRRMADLRGNRLAMIFQEPMTSLNPVHSVGWQLTESFQRHCRDGRRAARERALHLLARVGIPAAAQRLDQYPHQLSGGLRQRVMIAMSLMCEPDLLIADEPTTALDVTIQAQILHLLAELRREFGLTLLLITHDLGVVARVATARALVMEPELLILDERTSALDVSVQAQILNLLLGLRRELGLSYLFISHDLAVVEHLADRVAVMYLGEVVEEAPTVELFREPRHPYTRALLASVLTPEPGLGVPDTQLGAAFPDPLNPPPGCAFHPRCPAVMARCRGEAPGERWAEESVVRCHLY